MAITFDRTTLLLENRFISRVVRRWWRWPLQVINTPLRPTSSQSVCRAPNWPRVPPLKPNQLYLPSGATRWSRVLLLTSKDGAEALSGSVGILRFDAHSSYPSRTVTATAVVEVPDDPDTEPDDPVPAVLLQWHLESSPKLRMHLLQPIPMSDHGEDVPPPIVLPMVDDRYFWQGRLTTTTAETWEDLLNDLIKDLAEGTGVDSKEYIHFQLKDDDGSWIVSLANPDVSVPDPCVFRNGPISTAAALDLACWTLGLRCVPMDLATNDSWTRYLLICWDARGTEYPEADEIYEKQLTALKAELINNSGAEIPSSPDNADIPRAVRFRFSGDYRLEKSIAAGSGPYRDFWTPAVAHISGSFPLNGSELSNMTELWRDSWQKQLSRAFHWSWNGTPNLRFSGYEDYILYNLGLPPKGSTPYPVTHQRSLPRNVGYEYIPFQLPEYAHRDCGVTTMGTPVTPTAGGCVCCDCMDCIDLCEASSPDVVQECAGCPHGALRRYVVSVGNWLEYPNITAGGTITLDHQDVCEWRSETVSTDGGTYQWVLSLAEGEPELFLEHLAGADPLRITNGYWQLKWIPATGGSAWSCLCHMAMKIASPDKTPRPTEGLNCSVCLMPRLTQANRVPASCSPVEGVLPCVEPFDFPALAFHSTDPLEFPYGFNGSTAVTFDMEWTIDIEIPCKAVGGDGITAPSGLNSPANVSAVLNYGAGILKLLFQAPHGSTFREYHCAPEDLVLGDNVFLRQPLPLSVVDDSTLVTWPETVIVTLSDCRFGATHPDYGYGCGAVAEPYGCGGVGCQYVAIDSEGTQAGLVGPWSWGGCVGGGGCPSGCTIPGPPEEPPTGPGDTYSVLCQPV